MDQREVKESLLMPHIISDSEYREFTAYRETGQTPEMVKAMATEESAPLPLPLWAENMLEADAMKMIPVTQAEA